MELIIISVSTKKRTKPLREVDVDYNIDNTKCSKCVDKPCLKSCPVEAIFLNEDDIVDINEDCFGCVLCRNACPYDAIEMTTTFAEPVRENVPNINRNLCIGCGGCVKACRTGSVHLESTGDERPHSVIDEDTCIRCGYCFRSCPTDAIKFGVVQPKTVQAGKSIIINEDECIGCMTCSRVCPSKGAINVGSVSKLPYIDPLYCARCEECMDICPTLAIKYGSRKKALNEFNRIRSMDLASLILKNQSNTLSKDMGKIYSILNNHLEHLSNSVNEDDFSLDITQNIIDSIYSMIDDDISIYELNDIIERSKPLRTIEVNEDNCIGCGECISVCPINCIELIIPSPIKIHDECIFCGKCVNACQIDAIKLTDDFLDSDGDSIFYNKKNVSGLRDGKWKINHDPCQQCEICLGVCPVDAISVEDDKIKCNEEDCLYCMECESICPVDAIKIDIDSY